MTWWANSGGTEPGISISVADSRMLSLGNARRNAPTAFPASSMGPGVRVSDSLLPHRPKP
jgi:hypothetical protein